MEITADDAVGAANTGAVVWVAMAVTAFGPGGDAPGGADDDVTLTLLSQPPMMFQDSRWRCRTVWARWRRRSIMLLTMVYGRNVPRCCTISVFVVFARTLTYSVGRCWATRLRTWSLWPCGFSQVQGPCGRSRVLLQSCTFLAMRTARETCCRIGCRGRGVQSACTQASSTRSCGGRTHPRYGVGGGFT